MKRVQKNILGLSGLALVAGMTACAVMLPSPEASATTNSVTDTLVVRVVEDKPTMHLTTTAGEVVYNPNYPYHIDYIYAKSAKVTITYTNADGETYEKEIYNNPDADYNFTEEDLDAVVTSIKFEDGVFGGYGDYKLTAEAIALDGTPYEDYLTFKYIPVSGIITTDSKDEYTVKVTNIDQTVARVQVRLKDLTTVVGNATIAELNNNGMLVPLDQNLLGENGCQDELYLYAYDDEGNLLYSIPYKMTTVCPEVPDTGAPDTGGLFQNLNIAKEDYLITGLIVFFILGIVGFGVVARGKRTTTNSKKRR